MHLCVFDVLAENAKTILQTEKNRNQPVHLCTIRC